MKNLLMLIALLFSSALFAEETIIQSAPQEIVISKSEDKNVDRFYYNFGTIPQGAISQARYYVTNNGDYPVYMRNARITGPGYYAYHNCNVLNPRGGRCSFTIEFRPWYEGYYSGQFSMSFDPDYTVIVQLAGQAYRY